MALTANREVDHYVDQELRSYPVAGGAHVYKGGFVTLSAGGYAEPLAAGHRFAGLAYEEANNTGADGARRVRVFTLGDFGHALGGATLADVGRPVFASADNTLTFTPGGNTFVGYVKDVVAADEIVLRLDTTAPAGLAPLQHHTANFSLTAAQSGTVHSNLGAAGAITATLPANPPAGTEFKFVCMTDLALRLAPGPAGGIYIKGDKQADNKYVSVTDIGDFVHLVADGNGDWVAVASIGGADGDVTVEA
jgi:hypothetical protein